VGAELLGATGLGVGVDRGSEENAPSSPSKTPQPATPNRSTTDSATARVRGRATAPP
jgi:hypothetical protein